MGLIDSRSDGNSPSQSLQASSSFWLLPAGLAIGLTGVFVASSSIGPHVDSYFEFARYIASDDLLGLLREVALDNQPPASPILGFMLLRAGAPLESLRFIMGAGLLLTIALASYVGLRASGRDRLTAARISAAFVAIVSWSPAVAPVLVMLRYASLMTVAWVVVFLLGINVLRADDRRFDVALGIALGLSTFVAVTSVVLIGLWAVLIVARVRPLRRWLLVLLGMFPPASMTLLWFFWAGPEFLHRVIGRSTARPSIRTVLGQTYEQTVWPVLGIVSLPTPAVIALGSAVILSGALLLTRTADRSWWLIGFAGIAASVPVMVATQVVNGGLAGPTAVLLLAACTSALSNGPEVSRTIRRTSLAIFATGSAALSLLAGTGSGLLRPYLWDGGAAEAATIVAEVLEGGDERDICIIDSGDYATEFHLPTKSIHVSSPNLERCLDNAGVVILVRGDHRSHEEARRFLNSSLDERGMTRQQSLPAGKYIDASLRDRLGLRVIQDSHIEVHVYARSSPS
jgi:hypothetical protein